MHFSLHCLLAGCGSSKTTESTQPTGTGSADAAGDEPKKVVFMVNGSLGDKGFFDSCQEGIERLGNEYGCEVKTIEMGRDETAYETYFRITFPSNEAGFMAGCLAALKLNAGDEKIDPNQKIVGFVGSMDTTNINDFLVGYIDGIKYIDDSIKVITSYVGSFEDVATCLEMTTQLYNQGAQIVYAPASQSIVGAVTASSDCDKYIIGCDTDLYSEMVETDPNLVRNVLSSSLKKMGDAVVTASTSLWDGSMSLGENYSLGLAEGTVGLADNDNFQTLVSEEIRTQLDEIATKVANGEIEVSSAYTMDTAAIETMRNEMKP